MKKGIVLSISVLSLLGILIAIFYQVSSLKALDRTGLRQKPGNNVTIEDNGTPLEASVPKKITEDGYTIDNTDIEAPKKIESTKITSFFCIFSTLYDETNILGNKRWELRADLDGSLVKGSYSAWDFQSSNERRFEADKAFMSDLFSIIDRFALSGYNGLDTETKGIPDEYGATISVVFDSGESIYASDNTNNFLPPEAEDELVQLFAAACANGKEVIGVSVSDSLQMVDVQNGSGYLKYPVLTIGRNDVFGETDDLKYPAEDELRYAINQINSEEYDEAFLASGRFGKGSQEKSFYYDSDLFITRNDTEVVSLYIKECSLEEADQEYENTTYKTYNIDASTGELLSFRDVFRDYDELSKLIADKLLEKYKGQRFPKEAAEAIEASITDEDGNICFALGNGFIHIFINEYVLNDAPGGYHLTLSLQDYPQLISNFYKIYPADTLTRLDYDTDYYIDDGLKFKMECDKDPGEEDIYWRGIVGENVCEATYYGHAPEAYLVRKNSKNYLYLNLPTGDVSFHGVIYEIKKSGLETLPEQGDLGLTVAENTTLDPDYFLMNMNEVIDGTVCFMYPTGAFKVDVDGFPASVSNIYRLQGSKVKIKETGRYNPSRVEDAANSGGMFYVTEGTEVTPYASDLKSYIDFITTEETEPRILRFTTDEFSPEMKLDNFGKLNDVFKY